MVDSGGMKSKTDFSDLLEKIRDIGYSGKLNGLLCTPNIYCKDDEFVKICEFAKLHKAKYVLFNPLSKMGRGQKTSKLSYDYMRFDTIKKSTQCFIDDEFEVIYIRFQIMGVRHYLCVN